jgi:multidrug efflux pump subunit AcrB
MKKSEKVGLLVFLIGLVFFATFKEGFIVGLSIINIVLGATLFLYTGDK